MFTYRIVFFFLGLVSNLAFASPYSHFIHSLKQRFLILDNGFIWEIDKDAYNKGKVNDWKEGDEIVLNYEDSTSWTLRFIADAIEYIDRRPCHKAPIEIIFSLTNMRTNTTVEAFYHDFQDVWIAPQIKSIDLNGKRIVLTDNTQWKVGWVHSFYSSDWKPGHRILIMPQEGSNNSYILVNPDYGMGPHYKSLYYDSAVQAKLVNEG